MRFMTWWVIIVVLLNLQGCASTRPLIEQGDRYYQAGQFELALREYQQALQQDPDNAQVVQKRHMTARQLQLWLERLLPETREAENNGETAKALLLYRKFQHLTGDTRYGQLYGQLRDKLWQENSFRITVKANEDIFKLDIANVLITGSNSSYPVHRQINFQFSKPEFTQNMALYEKSVPYVSGTGIRDNPDYVALQQQLLDKNYAVKLQRQDNRQYQQDMEHYQKAISAQEHRIDEFDNRLKNLEPGTTAYQQMQQQMSDIKQRKKKFSSKLQKITKKYYRAQNQVDNLLDIVNGISYRLTDMEPVVEVDIFSDYIFVIEKNAFQAKAKLYTTIDSSATQISHVTGTLMDEHHEAHDTIGLPVNPLTVPSQEDLLQELYTALAYRAEEQIHHELMEYLAGFRSQAQQAGSSTHAIKWWVAYALAGDIISSSEALRLSQILHQYYGQSVEFTIDELLGLNTFRHHYRIYDY